MSRFLDKLAECREGLKCAFLLSLLAFILAVTKAWMIGPALIALIYVAMKGRISSD